MIMHLDTSFLAVISVEWEVALCIVSNMCALSRNAAFEKGLIGQYIISSRIDMSNPLDV